MCAKSERLKTNPLHLSCINLLPVVYTSRKIHDEDTQENKLLKRLHLSGARGKIRKKNPKAY